MAKQYVILFAVATTSFVSVEGDTHVGPHYYGNLRGSASGGRDLYKNSGVDYARKDDEGDRAKGTLPHENARDNEIEYTRKTNYPTASPPSPPASPTHPEGVYKGSDTVLALAIDIEVEINDDSTFNFSFNHALGQGSCQNEPYTLSTDGTIQVSNLNDEDNCVASLLDQAGAELQSLTYDKYSDSLTLIAKIGVFGKEFVLDHV